MIVTHINADTIVVCIKDVLLHMNLRIHDAHGQCYDGYSTMTETKNGDAAQIEKPIKKFKLMHCYYFSLNLGVGDK